jgi:fatty acid/phospholipid biosynthesis enzyme
MEFYHRHHIIPQHMGGDNDLSNIIEVNIATHAFLHRCLYVTHGKLEDKLAYMALEKQISKAEVQLALVKRPKSEETRRKISEAKKGQPSTWKGKSPSPESREKMRQAKIGKKLSDEHKKKIGLANVGSIANRGRKHTVEARENMRQATIKTWEKRRCQL